jgi:hypothetical protein
MKYGRVAASIDQLAVWNEFAEQMDQALVDPALALGLTTACRSCKIKVRVA